MGLESSTLDRGELVTPDKVQALDKQYRSLYDAHHQPVMARFWQTETPATGKGPQLDK